jgi:hypothetical protein
VKLVLAKLVHEGRVLEQRGVYTSTPSSSSQSAAAATAGDEELQNAKAAAVNSKL